MGPHGPLGPRSCVTTSGLLPEYTIPEYLSPSRMYFDLTSLASVRRERYHHNGHNFSKKKTLHMCFSIIGSAKIEVPVDPIGPIGLTYGKDPTDGGASWVLAATIRVLAIAIRGI